MSSSAGSQTDLREEFPLEHGLIYLNHAAVAPWPRRTAAAVKAFAEENLHRGSWDYPKWVETEAWLREQCRLLLNAPSATDIALLKNTSEALSVVAHGLDWHRGDNVVISNEEFPSNRIAWQSLAPQGVETHQADLAAAATPEEALVARVDARTRVLAVSSVQYASGLRLDIVQLGEICKERNILFCVDAIQSLGALPLDVQRCGADFVMADGHKWLLAPEGCAIFYARAEARERLTLHQYGWHMVENHLNFSQENWRVATSARRFECGSPNMLCIHALSASLELLAEVGMEEVTRRVLANSEFLLTQLSTLPGIELLTPRESGRYAGIVTFRNRGMEPAELHRRLLARRILCAQRGEGVRLSPHFYTPRAHLEQAVEAVRELTLKG
ncbi:MAG TPA: aminotransferase class V-fold PLP-dependent enzyme [Thiobacillaceae bacterium]|nr:aminotransferase class V-fold PLP-dependent enzyme [Thiobacillaceae bacterium]